MTKKEILEENLTLKKALSEMRAEIDELLADEFEDEDEEESEEDE